MQSTLEGRVAKLEGSMGGVRETLEAVEGRTVKLDSRKDQFKEHVLGSIGTNVEDIQGALKSIDDKLSKRNDRSYGHGFKGGTKAMMTRIEELEGELTVCRAAVGKGMMALVLEQRKMDVPKSKEFKGTRFTTDMDNFLWGMNITFVRYALRMMSVRFTDERRGDTAIGTWMEFQNKFRRKFYLKHAKENAQAKLCQLMQQDTIREYVREFPNLSEKEAFYLFNDGFKPSTKQELHRLRVKELTKAISKAKCFLELGPRKGKFESSKPKETGNDRGTHKKEQDKNDFDGNGKNGSNGKLYNGKRKPNNHSRG
ncbi:hypothetical protein Gogos_020031 [Gossypium gossypioides]|uniref:Retrotransposon gag domain-containing protein n=1 Tax=Gossypium gossypioides TaxID=34282 RepID=A0A7J9CYJ7_GOSGO|nr:hypothetical protein [Gossypium gossypioides]